MKPGNRSQNGSKQNKTIRTRANDASDGLPERLLTMATLVDAALQREAEAVSRELHDDLGQVLMALRMDISLLVLQNKADSLLVDKANTMLELMDRCMRTVCGLLDRLRSVNFEQGLVAALDSLCRHLTHQYKLTCNTTIICDCNGWDEALLPVIYRICHEALINVALHAQPCIANISLIQESDKSIHIEISDDGCGFDVSASNGKKGLGLLLMREAAVALGGNIEIVSQIGSGTQIKLRVPPKILINK